MDAAPIPLSPEDRAILDLEGPAIAGHTCKVLLLGAGAPGRAAVRDEIARRIDAAPLLTRRLGGTRDAPAWVLDERFDLDAHVVGAAAEPLAGAPLLATVARLFEERLDRSRPLWRIDVVPLRDGSALVWRIHHALADGTAAMRYGEAVLWDPATAEPPAPEAASAAHPASPVHAADDARRRAHLAGFLAREVARAPDRSPFDGPIGARREIAFARVALRPLHDAAKRLAGATLNDAVLALVAGALRRWLEEHHRVLGDVRVRVPVSLHREGDDAANRDSFFAVALPLGAADPVARLRTIRAETAVRKADHDAQTMDDLLRGLGRLSPRLRALAGRIEASPRRFAVNVSNVPGPRKPIAVCGTPVRALHSIAEIGRRHALRIAVVSLDDALFFGFCADPDLVDGLDAMARGVTLEAQALTA